MSMPSRAPSTGRRLLVLLSALCALVGGLVLAPSAEAKPKPPALAISSVVVTQGINIPVGGAFSPAVLVGTNQLFTVTVTFNQVVSTTKDTILTITQDSYPHLDTAGAVLGTVTVLAGQASGSSDDIGVISAATNRVVARATVTDGAHEALILDPAFSAPFDVVDPDHLGDRTAATGQVSLVAGVAHGTTGGTPCPVDAANPYCADVFFPTGSNGDVQLAFTQCDTFLGCGTDPAAGRQVLQVIFNSTAGISDLTPVTIIYRCDKEQCGQIGVPQFDMLVGTGDLTQPLTSLDKCRKQGVQTSASGFCFDTKQSTKDNAGDVYLYVLTTVDPRLSWP